MDQGQTDELRDQEMLVEYYLDTQESRDLDFTWTPHISIRFALSESGSVRLQRLQHLNTTKDLGFGKEIFKMAPPLSRTTLSHSFPGSSISVASALYFAAKIGRGPTLCRAFYFVVATLPFSPFFFLVLSKWSFSMMRTCRSCCMSRMKECLSNVSVDGRCK